LLSLAREEAQAALERSPRLTGDENRPLRTLLYLFERDEAVRLLEAG
jgi:ATP-dependent DNA helicase RecG